MRHVSVEDANGATRLFSSVDAAVQYGQRTLRASPSSWIRTHNALIAGVAVTLTTTDSTLTFRVQEATDA